MRVWLRGVLLVACLVAAPVSAGDKADDEKLTGMVRFVLDVEIYRGMFYAVYDYCKPQVPELVAAQSLNGWLSANQRYLDAQAQAELQFSQAIKGRPTAAESRQKLVQEKARLFSRWRTNNKMIAKVEAQEDKSVACSKLLGSMLSRSMELETLMPEDFRYWKEQYAK